MTNPHQSAVETVAYLYNVTEDEAQERYPDEIKAWEKTFTPTPQPQGECNE